MRICKVEECSESVRTGGYCNRHYQQMRKHGKIFKRTMFDPNEIIIKDDIAEVVLYKNNQEVARSIIDAEDIQKVKGYKWYLSPAGYAKTGLAGKHKRMQHIIMGVESNTKPDIDHKDRNKLNNRKFNYRFCTHKENSRNAGKYKNNTSGYKGVSWHKLARKWSAQITVNSEKIHLGCFTDKPKAAKAYNEAATKHFGEFACINEI